MKPSHKKKEEIKNKVIQLAQKIDDTGQTEVLSYLSVLKKTEDSVNFQKTRLKQDNNSQVRCKTQALIECSRLNQQLAQLTTQIRAVQESAKESEALGNSQGHVDDSQESDDEDENYSRSKSWEKKWRPRSDSSDDS